MRTAILFIQTNSKRKFDNDKESNAENIDPNMNEKFKFLNKKLKSDSIISVPTSEAENKESKSPLKITHNFIRSICDTIKRSAKRIFEFKFYDKNDNQYRAHAMESKENKSPEVQSFKENNHSDIKDNKCKRPNFSTLTSLPLNENLCIQDPKFVETVSTKMSLFSLAKYLTEKKQILKRSRTTHLPTHVICSTTDIQKFLWLIEEDPMISLFLKRDICRRYADKYLLAMVLIYFVRAQFTSLDFSRENFFAALYLAHDMEEDHEEMKYEVFPYCLGTKWRKYYTYLLSIRDDLFWALDCRAVVSKKCCEQVMGLIPNHWIWKRERPDHHSLINRLDSRKDEFCQPKGPFRSPLWCKSCLERECIDSENDYIIYSSLSDTSSVKSPDLNKSRAVNKDSGFESFLFHEVDYSNNDQDFDTSLESNEVLTSSPGEAVDNK